MSQEGQHAKMLETAKNRPGRLSQDGLSRMTRYLGQRGGVDPSDPLPPVVLAYLTTIYFPSKMDAPGMTIRNRREMRTWAEVLDHLLRGDHLRALDMGMHRLKALEKAVEDQSWKETTWMELMPPEDISISSTCWLSDPRPCSHWTQCLRRSWIHATHASCSTPPACRWP